MIGFCIALESPARRFSHSCRGSVFPPVQSHSWDAYLCKRKDDTVEGIDNIQQQHTEEKPLPCACWQGTRLKTKWHLKVVQIATQKWRIPCEVGCSSELRCSTHWSVLPHLFRSHSSRVPQIPSPSFAEKISSALCAALPFHFAMCNREHMPFEPDFPSFDHFFALRSD